MPFVKRDNELKSESPSSKPKHTYISINRPLPKNQDKIPEILMSILKLDLVYLRIDSEVLHYEYRIENSTEEAKISWLKTKYDVK